MGMGRALGIPTAILRVCGAPTGAFTTSILVVVRTHAHFVPGHGMCQEHHLIAEWLTQTQHCKLVANR